MPIAETTSSNGTKTFQLSRPITTHSGEIRELEIRQPIFRNFIDHGMFYRIVFEDKGDTSRRYEEIDYKVLMNFIAELSGVDRESLKTITGSDMKALGILIVQMIETKNPQ